MINKRQNKVKNFREKDTSNKTVIDSVLHAQKEPSLKGDLKALARSVNNL